MLPMQSRKRNRLCAGSGLLFIPAVVICSLFCPFSTHGATGQSVRPEAVQGQNPESVSAADIPVLHATSNLVLLDVLVVNRRNGHMITNLTADDFALQEDGVPQQISYFTQDKLPLSILFLFDLTDSVQLQLKALGAGAQQVLEHLKPEDEVSVETFSSRIQQIQPFTRDRSLAAAAILKASTMHSKEPTFIDEDVTEAVEAAGDATLRNSRRVLVFFTDGTADPPSRIARLFAGRSAPAKLHTHVEAEEALLRSGVTVAALIDRPPLDDAMIGMEYAMPLGWALNLQPKMNDVSRYAAQTGGPVLKSGGHKVAADLASLLDAIRARYTLGYVPTTDRPAGSFCRIRLTLTQKAYEEHPELRNGRYEVRTRVGYYR